MKGNLFLLITYIVFFIFEVSVCLLCMRYNIHMLQQNGYKNGSQIHWLRNNGDRQRFLTLYRIPLYLIVFLGRFPAAVIAASVFSLPSLTGYVLLKKYNTKKKLVFTKRVKRLICCMLLLSAILIVVPVIPLTILYGAKAGVTGAAAVLGLLIVWMPYAIVLGNLIMKPVETKVNNGFIKDAKRILARNTRLTVIGVTGSYGKTSLKFFLKELLSQRFNVLATPESFNTPMGVVRTVRESLKPTHELFICEMGAKHVGDIKELCDIVNPDHGVITSVGPQHLETFKSIENVRKTKFELAKALPAGGMLFVNGDSEEARKEAENFDPVYYGIATHDGFYAKDIVYSSTGTDFTVVTPKGEEERFHMRLLGTVNVLNVLGAITVASSFGVTLSELKVPVRRMLPVSHRLELREYGNITIIDDAYNSNPVGSKAAVETLKCFDGARILITPGMVELGEKADELHYRFGTYAADSCDYILLVNKYRTGEIKRGAIEAGFPEDKLFEFDRFTEAMTYACTKINDDRHKFILLENDLPDVY